MNKQKLVELFKDPSGIDSKLLEEVEEMVQENPYFHSAYALIAAGKKKTKAQNSGKDLIRAAIYATNRVNLKKYLENAGGQQATTPQDASLKSAEKTTVKKEVKSEVPAPAKEPEKPQDKAKSAFKERFVEEDPKRKKIRSRVEVEKEQASQKVEDQTTERTAPIDLDIEKLLDNLKSEYQQLETNIKSFTEAEKFLTEAEIKEEKEKKSPKTASTTKAKAPAKPAAKKSATANASAAKTTSKSTAATKKASTTKTTTAKKSTSTAKKSTSTTAKKATSTTAKKATTTKKTAPKSTTKASSKSTAKPTTTKTTTKSKASTRKINIDSISEDDLLAGDEPGSSKKKEQKELIDNFIKAEPKISAKKESAKEIVNQEDLSKKNQVLGDDIVTENLANIMVKQGRIEKAVEIYNKLIWKFPHKKAYFAGRIKELKEQ